MLNKQQDDNRTLHSYITNMVLMFSSSTFEIIKMHYGILLHKNKLFDLDFIKWNETKDDVKCDDGVQLYMYCDNIWNI